MRDLTPHISDWIECYASMYPAPEVLFLPYYTALGFLLACHLLHYSILKFSSISCRIRTVIVPTRRVILKNKCNNKSNAFIIVPVI